MIDIVPAILPRSAPELKEVLEKFKGMATSVQVDLVGDNVLLGEEMMPFWEDFEFEFDLMTDDSLRDARAAVALGASRVVMHADFPQALLALEALQQTRTGDYPVLAGVALPSSSSPRDLGEFAGLYDFVQVMGIAEVGAQGRPFDERALGLIENLRAEYPALFIQVDGAVAGHIQELVSAGASRLVVGSALVNSDDPKSVYKKLYTEANVDRGKS